MALTKVQGELVGGGTGALTVPVGTTAERPASPTAGMIRQNTTTGNLEWYDATTSQWKPTSQPAGYTVNYFKGVHFHRGANKWRAVVSLNNKPKHLGLYKTPEEASAAYNGWCAANRGEFAWIQPCHLA